MYLLIFTLFIFIIIYFYTSSSTSTSTSTSTSSTKQATSIGDKFLEKNDIGNALNNYLLNGDLLKTVRIYRFGRGEDSALKDFGKARTILEYIMTNGTPLEKEEARMIAIDIQNEESIENINKEMIKRQNELEQRNNNRIAYNQLLNKKINMSLLRREEPQLVDILPTDIVNGYDKQLETAILNSLKNQNRKHITIKVPIIPPQRTIINDTQNVHDSVIVRSVKDGLEKANINNNLSEYWITELQGTIKNEKAIKTFNKMINEITLIPAYNMSEKDILKTVYNRINDPINNDRKNDMMEILQEQLKDGSDVCAMGRCTRVLQTLEGTDKSDTVNLKTEWMIKEEITNNGSKIYNDMFQESNIKDILSKDEEELTENEKQQFNNFKDEYSNKLKDKFKLDYKNIVSDNYIDLKVEELIKAI